MKWMIITICLIISGFAYGQLYPSEQDSLGILAGRATGDYVYHNLNTTSVTSGAYVQVATLAAKSAWMDIYNGGGTEFYFATGSTGAQAIRFLIPPSGMDKSQIELPDNTKIWIKAASTGDAPTGKVIINFFGVPE